jgi:diguanylate cyclase (GGDEF)-like protein/PAS domain S-box-containing protein
MVSRYAHATLTTETIPYWKHAYLIGVCLAGLTWGASAILLFPLESISHQVFVAFVLAGMAAGAVAVLAARMEVCLIFLLTSLLPLALQFFRQNSQLATAMGTMTLIFLAGMLCTARTLHLAILSGVNLRFDKRELLIEIKKRRRVEESLFHEKERLQTTLASIGDGVVITDAQAVIEYLNLVAEQLCGWSSEAAHQQPLAKIFCSLDENTRQPTKMGLEHCLSNATRTEKHTVLLSHCGKEYLINELATPLCDRYGKVIGAVAVFRDVTEARQHTAKLAYQANHDALTQLPNRYLLRDRLEHAIAHALRNSQRIAILFIDLDRFKEVNDQLGHAAGDTLLRQVVMRLRLNIREVDTLARLGGDEFVVVLEALSHAEQATVVSQKLLKSLQTPFDIEGHSCLITASIGIALFPEDGSDTETLLRNADTAMYRAKEEGTNNARLFTWK